MTHPLALVVATKDRPDDLRQMLNSLRNQTMPPKEVILVDASSDPVEGILKEFPELTLRYVRHLPPSAAAQRNAGIRVCSPDVTLIGFADDDVIFEPDAFEHVQLFWENASPDILGAAFNLLNYPRRGTSVLKHSRISEALGLYSSRPGTVSQSGWQTVIPGLATTQFVDWLPTTAVTFRKKVFESSLFDSFYESYSYLEDLDLSYTVSRGGRLAVVAEAGFSHFPSPNGRITPFQFGRYEVRNRLHFVRKHNLSLSRCYLGLAIRLGMSTGSGIVNLKRSLLERAIGNLQELLLGTISSDSSDGQELSRPRKHSPKTTAYPASDKPLSKDS
jgi:GT2 family glycosyltransferase